MPDDWFSQNGIRTVGSAPSQAAGMVTPGNIDMGTRPRVKNPDGSTSTVRSMSVNMDGREVLIPTVSDDGRILGNDEAVATYKRTGKHLGMFDTPDNATAFAQKLHESEAAKLDAADGGDWFAQNGIRTVAAAALPPDLRADPHARPPSAEDFTPSGGWPAKIGDIALGVLKGVGSTAVNTLGEGAVNAGLVPGVLPNAFGPAELRNPVFTKAEKDLTASNTAQRIGKVAEQGAELLIPTGLGAKAAVEAIPSAARAAGKFQEVMGAAKNIPINITEPGNVALRIQELADRGGSMPMAVRKFINHVTDPDKPAMTYEVARDFASNISRLSANEFGRLTPIVAREVAGMRVALNKSVAEAAAKAGKGAEYAQAMTEYGKAMRLKNVMDDFVQGAKRVAPYATAAGAGTWLTSKVMGALGG